MTLIEAVRVFWPDGPLTVASLRTKIRAGRLQAERIAGKILVTPTDIREMRARCRSPVRHEKTTRASTDKVDFKGAQAAASEAFKALRKRPGKDA